MSIKSVPTGDPAGVHPVVAAVEVASAVLDEVLAGSLCSLPDDDLLALLEAQERAAAKLAEVGLSLAREAHGRAAGGG